MKKISVSTLLNMYFDEIDINSMPVQRGIYRGVGLDVGIDNYFNTKKFQLPDKNTILKRTTNPQIRKEEELLYEQTQKCYQGFEKLINTKDLKILEMQKHIENDKINMHGFLDSIIKYKKTEYIVDWKSKEKFDDYNLNESVFKEKFKEYKTWCENNSFKGKKYEEFRKSQIIKCAQYSLGHLRYCLQVCLYWIIAGCPENTELMICYFDTKSKWYMFTFDKFKCKNICNDLIKFSSASVNQRLQIKKKLKIINWKEIINWTKVN